MEPRDFLMFPYAFSLYPVLQCCLIHMYNTKNPEPRIAGPAKVDLATGLGLINRLKKMSHNANKLHSLLETIMENNSISLHQGHDTMDERRSTSPSTSTTGGAKTTAFPSRVSDVGRGMAKQSPSPLQSSYRSMQPTTTATSTTASSSFPSSTAPLLFQQSFEMSSLADIPRKKTKDRIKDSALTSVTTTLVISSSPSPSSSLNEAFSLKQFGFDTPGDPNQLDLTMQDVSAFSRMDCLPPIPDQQQTQPTVLDQPSSMPPVTLFDQQHPPYPSSQPIQPPLSNDTSPPTSNYTMYPSQTMMGSPSVPVDAHTVFRYNPNNPFFGIPSSMDWSDIAWNQSNMFK